ncbi:hypothetical protein CEXT_373941 [Caerostris extrusa]|uniref:Uncharacterized protein n=1 Tax=Caerostris extrusa TaxID=172846 RepID=A0AAV4P0W8_CAEEX|nr:hypothetical protein CEXT_373941 [Caerostris extrusa]
MAIECNDQWLWRCWSVFAMEILVSIGYEYWLRILIGIGCEDIGKFFIFITFVQALSITHIEHRYVFRRLLPDFEL